MDTLSLSVRYTVFAAISTVVNIAFQWLSFYIYTGFLDLYVALAFGTLSGLVVKYVLDKKFIFFHTSESKKEEGKTFFLYSFMGVFTTFIFWGIEILFDYLFTNEDAKYIGGILGLAIGYIVKYQLDKKFVFKAAN